MRVLFCNLTISRCQELQSLVALCRGYGMGKTRSVQIGNILLGYLCLQVKLAGLPCRVGGSIEASESILYGENEKQSAETVNETD